MRLIATLVAAVLLVPTAAWADNGSTSRRIDIEGIITAVDSQGGLIVVRGENGRPWLILVRPDTEVAFADHDDDEAALPFAGLVDLRVGDTVGITGLRLRDGRILALTLVVENNRPGLIVLPPTRPVVRGVVVAISKRSFVLVLQDRTVTVVVRSTTQFIAYQRPVTARALARYAVVLVRGVDLGDQILADDVELEFAPDDGVVLTGIVGALWLRGGAYLLAGQPVWVNVTTRTFIIQGQSMWTRASIPPHASVIIYGVNRSAATQAMVIVVR